MRRRTCFPLLVFASLGACGNNDATPPSTSNNLVIAKANAATGQTSLLIYGAGTLAVPFKEMSAAFAKQHLEATVQGQFGGSVKMVKQVTELNEPADVVAVADYSVIPKYMFGANGKPRYADWYVGFARNAMTFIYTPKSKYAAQINVNNWYNYLTQPDVQVGRSNPDTDPSGYIALQMLSLANSYYHIQTIEAKVKANSAQGNVRDTETSLIAPLELGQIDYLMTYRSDAIQHGFRYLDLPDQINLSNPSYADAYAKAVVRTKNGDMVGKPIIYAITIPANAPHHALAVQYVKFILGSQGQAILKRNGFGIFDRPIAVNAAAMPADLRPLVQPWPASGR